MNVLKRKHEKHDTVNHDEGSKHAFLGTYGRAGVMLLCYAIFLSFVYTQQEPDRYIESTNALHNELHLEKAGSSKNLNNFWEWIDSLHESLSGITYFDVLASYGEFATCKRKIVSIWSSPMV